MPISLHRNLNKQMRTKRKSFNPKRRIAKNSVPAELAHLAERVIYRGNPAHKRNPGDFDLAPPLGPRPGKTLCDAAGLFNRGIAFQLLRDGIRRGLVSERSKDGFTQNIWAVSDDGLPLEAQLENADDGSYHGYPMPQDDPFRELVLERWNIEHDG